MTMPSETSEGLSFFDRFATGVDRFVSRAWFFACCVLLIVAWAPTLLLVPIDSAQLLINTPTTVVTFLLVALQSNTTKRADAAIQTKLNAVADGLADLLASHPESSSEAAELRAAVGLEDKESS